MKTGTGCRPRKQSKKLAAVFHVSADYLMGIEKKESIDVTGLDEDDKNLVRMLVDKLREKNAKCQKRSSGNNWL